MGSRIGDWGARSGRTRVAAHATTSAMPAPTLTDGVVHLGEFGPDDVDAHLANEDEEMARRFGWWPNRSTAHDVRAAFERWAGSWACGGRIHAFAVRDVSPRPSWARASCASRRIRSRALRTRSGLMRGDTALRRVHFGSQRSGHSIAWASRASSFTSSPTTSHRGGVARRCGFVEEGVLRGRLRVGDVRRDALLYARLATDRSDQ
jgi:hypothetical protein